MTILYMLGTLTSVDGMKGYHRDVDLEMNLTVCYMLDTLRGYDRDEILSVD